MTLDQLVEDFALFDDWEDRYKYIIELGQSLSPLSPEEHNDENKVPGCASQVWLVTEARDGVLNFRGDSDAHLVKGLIAIILALYNGKSADDIVALDATSAFQTLGLKDHLTPQRSNGFAAMVQRIRKDAVASLED